MRKKKERMVMIFLILEHPRIRNDWKSASNLEYVGPEQMVFCVPSSKEVQVLKVIVR